MKAWVLDSVGNIELKDIDKPEARQGYVVVKVAAAGICGSDIPRIYKDGAHNMPLVPGHEFSGTVVDAVDADKTWIGKRVGIFPLIPCKQCGPCMDRKYEMCRSYNYLGSRCDGGFAEYVSVPVWNLIEIPDGVALDQAAMLEPLAVSVHAIRQFVNEGIDIKDKNIVICGLGTIGLMLLMFITELVDDMSRVYVIGSKESQKEKAILLGVLEDNYVDGKSEDVIEWAQKNMAGGADIYYECVGTNKTISDGINMVKPGGFLQLIGNPASDMTFDKNTYWKILRNQITVKGTWNSSFTGREDDDWHYVIERLAKGTLPVNQLITGRYDMESFRYGLELMRDKSADYIKILLEP